MEVVLWHPGVQQRGRPKSRSKEYKPGGLNFSFRVVESLDREVVAARPPRGTFARYQIKRLVEAQRVKLRKRRSQIDSRITSTRPLHTLHCAWEVLCQSLSCEV